MATVRHKGVTPKQAAKIVANAEKKSDPFVKKSTPTTTYPHFAAAQSAAKRLAAVEAPGAVVTDLSIIGDLSHGTFDMATVTHAISVIKSGKDFSAMHDNQYTHKYDAEASAAQSGANLPTPDPGTAIPQGITGGAATGLLNQFGSWEKALEAILGALANPQFWVRAGEVVIGGTMIIVGLDSMLKLNIGGNLAKAGAAAAL